MTESPHPDWLDDDDVDEEGNLDVEWYPLPAWLQEAWDELHEEEGRAADSSD